MIVVRRIAVVLATVPGIARHRRAPQPPGCGCCAVTVQDLAPDGATREANRRDRESIRVRIRGERHKRSEEHTSELQSLMRISYAVFCLKKKNKKIDTNN